VRLLLLLSSQMLALVSTLQLPLVAGYTPACSHIAALHSSTRPRTVLGLNAAPDEDDDGFQGRIAQLAPKQKLANLRGQRLKIQTALENAIQDEDYTTAALLRDDLVELKLKDPALLASELRAEMERHVNRERYDEAARCRDELLVLRRFLPQYQLAGLWKGNYPNHGDELVRIHYKGDELYATKVTGDEHVPAGEVTFRADLQAPADLGEELSSSGRTFDSGNGDGVGVRVEVLALSADGGHERREVEQYHGEGRIAARGFRHPHYVPGQLFLMDDDVIGFLWLPIGTFVVFSRVPEDDEPASDGTSADLQAALGLQAAEDELDDIE